MKTLLAVTFLAGLGKLTTAPDLAAQDLAIANARIIVGNGTVIDQGSVVVRAGRIASVAKEPANLQGARTIDTKGMTVMPGFIDAHRHIILGNEDQWFKEQSVPRMQEFLDAGYTTLMSGGGPVPGVIELKKQIESGALKGPRIVTSGRADPANFKTPELARAQVRKLAEAGVEIIKAAIDPDPTPQELQALAAVTDEARKHGLKTMVHAVSVPAMLAAVRAGAEKLVHTPHGGWLTEADALAVEEGKLADLVIVDGNPLESYWNLLNAKVVIKGGVIMVDKRNRNKSG